MDGESVPKENCKHSHRILRHLNNCSTHSANGQNKMSSGSLSREPDGRQDEFIPSHQLYIENLQQQIHFLENENSYLRNHVDHTSKTRVNDFPDGDILKKQFIENQKETQKLKMELKRKQVTIDYLMSKADLLLQKKEEYEALFHAQKSSYLEELVSLRKMKDDLEEKNIESEHTLEEKVQQENHLLGKCDSLQVQLEEMKREVSNDKVVIESLQQSKKEIQKLLFESNLRFEAKIVTEQKAASKFLVADIEELHSQLACAGRVAEQEKLMRKQLDEDIEKHIKRYAAVEAELAEVKAKLREQQSLCAGLEEIHMKTIDEIANLRSAQASYDEEVTQCQQQLRKEKERNIVVATQLTDEQRFKMREEQKCSHLVRCLEQKEEKLTTRESENTKLLRENTTLKDDVHSLKEQLMERDKEVEDMKQKVQKMHMSVEEFTQCTKAATRLESQRWMQLNQLAHGIQTISNEAAIDKRV